MIECPNCQSEMSEGSFFVNNIIEADEGGYLLDLIGECEGCDHKLNAFVNTNDMMVIDGNGDIVVDENGD